jgi:hypothetical protein
MPRNQVGNYAPRELVLDWFGGLFTTRAEAKHILLQRRPFTSTKIRQPRGSWLSMSNPLGEQAGEMKSTARGPVRLSTAVFTKSSARGPVR